MSLSIPFLRIVMMESTERLVTKPSSPTALIFLYWSLARAGGTPLRPWQDLHSFRYAVSPSVWATARLRPATTSTPRTIPVTSLIPELPVVVRPPAAVFAANPRRRSEGEHDLCRQVVLGYPAGAT